MTRERKRERVTHSIVVEICIVFDAAEVIFTPS